MSFNIKLVFDKELNDEIFVLLDYLNKSGFYRSTDKNKSRLDDITFDNIGDTGIVLKTIPHKYKLMFKKKNNIDKATTKRCALCEAIQNLNKIKPLDKAKSLLWRGYIIRPNDFPYMDNHLLILSSNHNHGYGNLGTQDMIIENKDVIHDMLALYKLMDFKGTMFFNGLAGNTQLHYHFHYTTETLPVQKYLYKYDIESEKDNLNQYLTKNGTNLFLFNSRKYYCFNGIFLYGKIENVGNDIFKIIKKIKDKKKEFNIVLIPKNENDHSKENVSAIIYMRDNSKLKDTDPALGASIVSGYYTREDITRKDVNKKIIEKFIRRICSIAVVKPNLEIINSVLK